MQKPFWTASAGIRNSAHNTGILILVVFVLTPIIIHAQATKEINNQTQFWWSLNSTTRFTEKLGVAADFHIRRNDFVQDPSFYFIRVGSHYWLTEKFTLTLGYAHMWQALTHDDWNTWTNENRIYEQLQYGSKVGRVSILNRVKNEQRWKEKVEDDVLTGEYSFSNRIRYLLSFSIPVSKNPSRPLIVLSNEILIQFGKEIVTNTFDQNRFFVGIKKNLSPAWAFDFGYMPVYQQKSTGYQYDLNHTIRWFFYYTPDFKKMKSSHDSAGNEE